MTAGVRDGGRSPWNTATSPTRVLVLVPGAQLTLPYLLDACVQLASGLRHLHACGILHRDLKSDNALVAGLVPLVVKWADFGCSVKLLTPAPPPATLTVESAAPNTSYGQGVCAFLFHLEKCAPGGQSW